MVRYAGTVVIAPPSLALIWEPIEGVVDGLVEATF